MRIDIEDIKMDNITILAKGGAPAEQALLVVPEKVKAYPDPQEFGKMTAYGFYIRHARNVYLSDIELKLENSDPRAPFIIEDVKGITLNNVRAQHEKGVPVFIIKNVTDFEIINCGDIPDKKIPSAADIKL